MTTIQKAGAVAPPTPPPPPDAQNGGQGGWRNEAARPPKDTRVQTEVKTVRRVGLF